MSNVKNSKIDIKMKSLHDCFYWEILWCLGDFETFSIEKTIKKFWKYVKIPFPVNGLKLKKACKIIRYALLKEGCKQSGISYSKNLIKRVSFYKDNNLQWKNKKNQLIKCR